MSDSGRRQAQLKTIETCRPPFTKALNEAYIVRCQKDGLKPQRPALSAEEIRLSKVVPLRTEKMSGPPDLMAYYTAVAAEAAFMNAPVPGLADIEAFIRILEKFGYVKLVAR